MHKFSNTSKAHHGALYMDSTLQKITAIIGTCNLFWTVSQDDFGHFLPM